MRLPRIDYPGARHHVMNRGAGRRDIFEDDEDRALFLSALSIFPERFGVRVHGYALMPNHYHLLLESTRGELSRAMRHLGSAFTRGHNAAHKTDGPLFRGRFRNRVVGTDAYWRHLLVYVHLNPVRAGLSSVDEARGTSHRIYLGQAPRPDWLDTATLQDYFDGPDDYLAYYHKVLNGHALPPEEFNAATLWKAHSTGAVAIPPLTRDLFRLADAMAEVTAVTGMNVEELIESPRGRPGNPANWLAMWWLSRRRCIPHGRIARAMGTGHTAVSTRVARVEKRMKTDEQLRAWVKQLELNKGDNEMPLSKDAL